MKGLIFGVMVLSGTTLLGNLVLGFSDEPLKNPTEMASIVLTDEARYQDPSRNLANFSGHVAHRNTPGHVAHRNTPSHVAHTRRRDQFSFNPVAMPKIQVRLAQKN